METMQNRWKRYRKWYDAQSFLGIALWLLIILAMIFVFSRLPTGGGTKPSLNTNTDGEENIIRVDIEPRRFTVGQEENISIALAGKITNAQNISLIAVRDDLETLIHIPLQLRGKEQDFSGDIVFTESGNYRLFIIDEDQELLGSSSVSVIGESSEEAEESAYNVRVRTIPNTLRALTPISLTFLVEKEGIPINELGLLGKARGYAVAFNEETLEYAPIKPVNDVLTPTAQAASFLTEFREEGRWRIFFQFKDRETIQTDSRWLIVKPPSNPNR